MKNQEVISEEIANVIDILEQIEDLKKMISIHLNDDDDLMINQYKYRKATLLKKLSESLKDFDISPTDLAA